MRVPVRFSSSSLGVLADEMLEAAAAGGALGIFLSVIFQLQIQDLLGGIHGPLPEFHVCRRTQKGAVLVEEAEAVGHGIILRLIPGLAGTVGLNVDAVAAVPTMPAGENVVHGGGGDDLPDGLPNHVLLPLGQKVAVVLVDIRYLKRFETYVELLNRGGVNAGGALLNTAIVVGFGGVGVAFNALKDTFVSLGVNLEYVHRIGVIAAGTLDTLPHQGGQITILAITHMNHKTAYLDICVTQLIIPLITVFAVTIPLCAMGL